jgi:hypothetical protein
MFRVVRCVGTGEGAGGSRQHGGSDWIGVKKPAEAGSWEFHTRRSGCPLPSGAAAARHPEAGERQTDEGQAARFGHDTHAHDEILLVAVRTAAITESRPGV